MKKLITLLLVLTGIVSTAMAGATWVGNSAINFNGTWYYCGTNLGSWCTGGAFNGATIGSITGLAIGAQSQVSSDNGDWGSGTLAMNYKIDNGDWHNHALTYESYGHGQYSNNMRFQSGGGTFTSEIVDISGLTAGNHTITIYFGPLDGNYDSNGGSDYQATFTIPETVSGTISASGWNTFSSNFNLDLSTIANGTAYVASAASGSTVTLTSCTDKVAAGEGLMIKGTPDATFTISVTADAATFSGTNKLVGLPNGGTVAKDNNNYVFGWPSETPTAYGFYLIDSTEPALGAGKSYLHTDAALSARLSVDFEESGDVTGISEMSSKKEFNGDFINLNGQIVQNPTKGLYIVNGKKTIIK